MDRLLMTISTGERLLAAYVEVWLRRFTEGNGTFGWEGHFEAGVPIRPGGYEVAAADGRRGRIRVTHVGLLTGQPNRAEFTGVGPFR